MSLVPDRCQASRRLRNLRIDRHLRQVTMGVGRADAAPRRRSEWNGRQPRRVSWHKMVRGSGEPRAPISSFARRRSAMSDVQGRGRRARITTALVAWLGLAAGAALQVGLESSVSAAVAGEDAAAAVADGSQARGSRGGKGASGKSSSRSGGARSPRTRSVLPPPLAAAVSQVLFRPALGATAETTSSQPSAPRSMAAPPDAPAPRPPRTGITITSAPMRLNVHR